MIIYGRLEKIYRGREYEGVIPDVATVVDQTGSGRVNVVDVTLDKSAVSACQNLQGELVLLEYTEVNGLSTKTGKPYTLRVDGRLSSAELLDAINATALAYA